MNIRYITLFILMAISSLTTSVLADPIYRVVNPDGSITFSDQEPLDGVANEVELGQTIIQPAVAVPVNPLVIDAPATADVSKLLRIEAPADETVIHGTDNRFTISASVSPDLDEGESLQLMHNGSAYGPTQESGQWDLARINPGAQKFSVQLLGLNGQQLSQSDTLTLYVIP